MLQALDHHLNLCSVLQEHVDSTAAHLHTDISLGDCMPRVAHAERGSPVGLHAADCRAHLLGCLSMLSLLEPVHTSATHNLIELASSEQVPVEP